MALLDRVAQMQEQGLTDYDIANSLKQEGFSPKEVNDAINQSKIKTAVSQEPDYQNGLMQSMQTEMQPSIMPSTKEIQEAQMQYQEPQYQETQEYYPQQAQEYYQPQIGTDTITEISEQVVEEKLAGIKKNIGNIAEFKTIVESRIIDLNERLLKIENTIDKLQSAIIGKIGNYGQSIQDINTEMRAMQESFGKVINPIVDRAREKTHKQEERQEEKQEKQTGKKSRAKFEDYLR